MAAVVTASSSTAEHDQPQGGSQTPPACMLDVLLPDTVLSILKLLSLSPACIVAFSLTCTQAHELCSDQKLWSPLCRDLIQTFPSPTRAASWYPSAWAADSCRELYICLLQPYRQLLQQRLWHTTKMPHGQLLVIDAQPPCLIARSIFYKNLQGHALSHTVFRVQLPVSHKVCRQQLMHQCHCKQLMHMCRVTLCSSVLRPRAATSCYLMGLYDSPGPQCGF